ncbi:MAG: sigma-70 family RNA polymerase sigma factor [Ferruginibacter sp.]
MDTTKEKQAFLELIEQNKGIIIKICNSYCRERSDREDLAQEMIYQIWKSGHRFNKEYRFSTWMYRIALNVAISYYRQNKPDSRPVSLNEWQIDIEEPPDTHTEQENRLRLLQLFISQMKELDKALLLLWSESKSYAEIGEILGITETNVATRLGRLKEKLKQQFLQHQS